MYNTHSNNQIYEELLCSQTLVTKSREVLPIQAMFVSHKQLYLYRTLDHRARGVLHFYEKQFLTSSVVNTTLNINSIIPFKQFLSELPKFSQQTLQMVTFLSGDTALTPTAPAVRCQFPTRQFLMLLMLLEGLVRISDTCQKTDF